MCKRRLLLLALVVVVFLVIPYVSANFVCGTINDYENISAAWFKVKIFYSQNPSQFTSCQVSPNENKFCCDPEEIKTVSWAIGKEINAKILQGNFVAPQKSLVISGEGYDVFPEMQLEKVITLHQPNKTIFLNQSSVFVNLSTIQNFNNLRYELQNPENSFNTQLCTNCNIAQFYLSNLTYGTHVLTIFANNSNGDQVNTTWKFTNLEYIHFGRKIECDRCGDNFVHMGSIVNMTIYLNLSHNATGELYDYFPSQWNFVGNSNLEEFGQNHGKVSWQISGKNIQKNYQVQAPSLFIPRRYSFQTGFGDYLGDKTPIIVRRFYSVFPLNINFIQDAFPNIFSVFFVQVSPENPFVMRPNHETIVQVALFPNESVDNTYGYIREEEEHTLTGALFNFKVGSNVNPVQTFVQFRIEKPSNIIRVKNASLYNYDYIEDTWNEILSSPYEEDDSYVYFQSTTSQKSIFAIKAEYGI